MKKLSVLAMAMIVMASCAKENVQPNNEPNGEKALLEIGLASTKTQLGTEDKVNKLFPILWSEGDEIAVDMATTAAMPAMPQGNQNPFMPGPPGRNNKKNGEGPKE